MDPTPTTARPRTLAADQRGAIMLTGLFMSCFLIGALWFVVGIGDAIVFRNKMQEAADVGAFSSAALHAKGMNFISLCNLVMLVGTVIHLVLGIISDVKLAQAIYTCIQTLGIGCIPAVADYEAAYRRWDSYFNVMSKSFKAIHAAQKAASYAYPALGSIEAYQNGAKYGGDARINSVHVLAVSSSLLPGPLAQTLGNAIGKNTEGLDEKEGLPVVAKPFSDLCKKVVSVSTTGVLNLLDLGKSQGGLTQKATGTFNKIVGAGLQARYCNKTHMHFEPLGPGWDRFWGEDGPYVVYGPAKNGNVWFQTWALNINPSMNETSESRVGIARGPKLASKYTKREGAIGYFAQAEMYLDCDSKWGDTVCNFEDQGTFTIKWRARLRRLDVEQITSGVVGAAMGGLGKLTGPTAGEIIKAASAAGGVIDMLSESITKILQGNAAQGTVQGIRGPETAPQTFVVTPSH